MSFFFHSKTRTPRLPNENKIIDLTATNSYYENDSLVCDDCGIVLLYDPKHPESSETKHFYVCPKCSQKISTEDPIIKRKGSLDIVTNDDAPTISVVQDEPPEISIAKRMKYGQRYERSTEIL